MDPTDAFLIYFRLATRYPHTQTHFLHFQDPYQCLIMTILSAQTTDATVNRVAPLLFERYPAAEDLASADILEVEEIIRPTGFYHAKARHILGAAEAVVTRFSGRVPATMDELLTLPGVGRKTANIVLHHAFGINAGVAVDTHVRRLAQRIGFSASRNPDQIEQDMMALFPETLYGEITYVLIRHGREICSARNPDCSACILSDLCPYPGSDKERDQGKKAV